MSPELVQYELDRVINTAKSFGWVHVSSTVEGAKAKVEFEKDLTGVNPGLRKIELDRIIGMLKNVGWDMVSSRLTDDKGLVSLEKAVKPEV